MASFTLEDTDPPCKVTLGKDLSKEELLGHKPFQQWLSALRQGLKTQASSDHAFNKAPYSLRAVEMQAIDRWGPKKIGFMKFKATVTNDQGEYLPGAVFLRGGSVAMLVSIYNLVSFINSISDRVNQLIQKGRSATGRCPTRQ